MTIRTLFSTRRPIDRPIEKVIDYYAADDARLQSEIEEYEVTDNVDKCFTRFLDVYDAGVRTGQVTEIGVWVAGFYGAGKSSFTKYPDSRLTAIEKSLGGPSSTSCARESPPFHFRDYCERPQKIMGLPLSFSIWEASSWRTILSRRFQLSSIGKSYSTLGTRKTRNWLSLS